MTYKVGGGGRERQSETETDNDRDRRRDREWDEEKVEGGTEGKEEVYIQTYREDIHRYRDTETDILLQRHRK